MGWTLNQEWIHGLFRAAQDPRRKRGEAVSRTRTVSTYTFGQTPAVDSSRVHSLVVLHETLAAELSRYLSVVLRTSIEVTRSSLGTVPSSHGC